MRSSPLASLVLVLLLGSLARAEKIMLPPDAVARACARSDVAERDRCLAGVALNWSDPRLCEAVPASRCRELAARAGIRRCADEADPTAKLVCESHVIGLFPAPRACDASMDRDSCIAWIALETRDPALLAQEIEDQDVRDLHLSAYVGRTGDLRALDYLEDPFRHDAALVSAIGRVGFAEGRKLGAEYCKRVRGGYGPDHRDVDEGTLRQMCRFMAGMMDGAVDRIRAADDPGGAAAVEARIEQEAQAMLAKVAAGELDLAALADESDPDGWLLGSWTYTTDTGFTDTHTFLEGGKTRSEGGTWSRQGDTLFVRWPNRWVNEYSIDLRRDRLEGVSRGPEGQRRESWLTR